MKIIYLTNDKETIVDDEDYDYLIQWNWYNNNELGVYRSTTQNNVHETIYIHRVIAARRGLKIDGLEIDHIDRNPLNNIFSNIRTATRSQNIMNQGKRKDNISGYKGVTWHKPNQKWMAQIGKDGKRYNLGYFYNPVEAAKAYDRAAKLLFGEFACLNFPEGD